MASHINPVGRVPSEEEYPSVHLLLLITGSVAAVKTGLLLDQLSTERCNIRIAATKAAFHFLRRAQPSKTGIPFQSIITDEQEWSEWQAMNDSVVHIELRRWADLVVLVPLNANTLAKMATGICDNLVSSVMRAWEVREKPVILCPAMNTAMWTHPVTAVQLGQLEAWYKEPTPQPANAAATLTDDKEPAKETASPVAGFIDEPGSPASDEASAAAHTLALKEAMFQVVGPVSKRLACGDIGVGGMASVEEIAAHIRATMELIREEKRRRFRAAREHISSPSVSEKPSSAEPEKASPVAEGTEAAPMPSN